MRTSSALLTVLVTMAAPVAGVVSYQAMTPSAAEGAGAVATDSAGSSGATRPAVRFRPCTGRAVLEDGACVTHRVRVVVVPAPGAPPVDARPPDDHDEHGWSEPSESEDHESGPATSSSPHPSDSDDDGPDTSSEPACETEDDGPSEAEDSCEAHAQDETEATSSEDGDHHGHDGEDDGGLDD